MRILFLTKPDDLRSEKAVEFLKRSANVQVLSGAWGSPLPQAANTKSSVDELVPFAHTPTRFGGRPKPKRMRWAIYQRLLDQYDELQNRWAIGMMSFVGRERVVKDTVHAHHERDVGAVLRYAVPVESRALDEAARWHASPCLLDQIVSHIKPRDSCVRKFAP
jgi:hypothetical protein